ncbi:hypothetical protein GR212_15275 [Rhizobium lusitanum]|uniref:DUF4145 domain-containing protein n=1 Tax=Rhizobium lusitanum TaxID=293958 RepID=A0A6L9U6P2_9HYPH|nr:hypothetical protein [Rhizobium lusitanum]NEI70944.1 hypothetical protein [Rhizobium lusitanum]
MFEVDKSIIDEIENGSDRACAIAGHAYIESLLPKALRAHLIESEEDWKILFGSDRRQGPVSSHGIVIRLAYLTGLISTPLKADLLRLKNIRNMFAHKADINSFEHADIVRITSKFEVLTIGIRTEALATQRAPSSRRKFEIAIGEVSQLLKSRLRCGMPAPILAPPT